MGNQFPDTLQFLNQKEMSMLTIININEAYREYNWYSTAIPFEILVLIPWNFSPNKNALCYSLWILETSLQSSWLWQCKLHDTICYVKQFGKIFNLFWISVSFMKQSTHAVISTNKNCRLPYHIKMHLNHPSPKPAILFRHPHI